MKKVILLVVIAGTFPFLGHAAEFSRNLFLGTRGDDVKALQEFLARDALLYPEGIISGYFGALTKRAVVRFQEREKIMPAAGFVGEKTRARLNALSLAAPSTPVSPVEALEAQLLLLQQMLREMEEKAKAATTSLPAEPINTPELPLPVPPPEAPPMMNSVLLSGGGTRALAGTVVLGGITVTNQATSSTVIFRIRVDMEENINAPQLRGTNFDVVLRGGLTTDDPVLTRQRMRIPGVFPGEGRVNKDFTSLYAGVTLAPGEARVLGLWAEDFIGAAYGGKILLTVTIESTIPFREALGSAEFTLQ
ncbi:MAG: peptidoglycan-binding protein [Candidatus Sungbacteria bacterium]|nr:peptidoglycan-binding protein [Candidatus Sungbacteria bacterium]